jgi:hypothetical protein
MKSKYEHIQFIIQRFDHYYDTVNNKGAFYVALNTFIFGGICAGYISMHSSIKMDWLTLFLIGLLLTSCLISLIYTILAIKPYTKDNHNNKDTASLMFFGGIARHELQNLKEKMKRQTDEEVTEDAIEQMHCLAKGLTGKFNKLRIASNLLQVQFLILLPLFFLIVKNLK